jgi:hypothetical protein
MEVFAVTFFPFRVLFCFLKSGKKKEGKKEGKRREMSFFCVCVSVCVCQSERERERKGGGSRTKSRRDCFSVFIADVGLLPIISTWRP